jgi:hypothetical protein
MREALLRGGLAYLLVFFIAAVRMGDRKHVEIASLQDTY